MTRTELKEYANKIYLRTSLINANVTILTGNAVIFHYPDLGCDILRSYNTIVGIFSHRTGAFYSFGTYSNTTVKHIYKAVNILNAICLTWLCVRSDKRIEQYIGHYADESKIFYADKEGLDNLIRCDWSSEIETKWKEL